MGKLRSSLGFMLKYQHRIGKTKVLNLLAWNKEVLIFLGLVNSL